MSAARAAIVARVLYQITVCAFRAEHEGRMDDARSLWYLQGELQAKHYGFEIIRNLFDLVEAAA